MPKDITAWPWDQNSLIVDARIDWPSVPVSSMESISPRIIKKLKRDDLVRLMSDPLLGFLRKAIPANMLAGIQNTIAGKSFSFNTDEDQCPTTSPKSQSVLLPLESSSGTSSTNSELLTTSASATSATTTSATSATTSATPATKKNTLTTPEDVIRELEAIARNAEAESEYGAQIAALKLIGEQMAMFQKNKPQDPNITINILTGVLRS